MSNYSIKDLEKLSNVKAHTIRIWEQRYKLLQPERTETNIRYYDDEQLKKLLNVQALMVNGMKISHISKLNAEEIQSELATLLLNNVVSDGYVEMIIGEAIAAVAAFDERTLEILIDDAISKTNLESTYKNILLPMLIRIGHLWAVNDLMPAYEHFLSYYLERKIFSAINSLPLNADSEETWVLFLIEPEEHEIGLLMANYIIRKQGKKVIYLGRRVPAEHLENIVRKCNATSLYTFFVRNQPEKGVQDQLENLLKISPALNIYISGKERILKNINVPKNITVISDINSLIEIVTQ